MKLYDQQNFTVKEAAVAHAVSEKTIRRWIALGRIRVIQPAPGCAIRIDRKEWERFRKLNQR